MQFSNLFFVDADYTTKFVGHWQIVQQYIRNLWD